MAAAAILTGKYTFARIQPALPQALLPARTSLALVPAAKGRFVRKPVYVAATGAMATCAATLKQAPALQEAFAAGSRKASGQQQQHLAARQLEDCSTVWLWLATQQQGRLPLLELLPEELQ